MEAFAEVLRRFADESADARLAPIVAGLDAPIRVAVSGRAGVGRGAVARGLAHRWHVVDTAAEVVVVVIAEALKPEDEAVVAQCRADQVPSLLVRNKADLDGPGGVRTPGVPCAALLADVTLDEDMVSGLRRLAAGSADLSSLDAGGRLLEALDVSGIGHCVRALECGVEPVGLPALLRAASGFDAVLRELDSACAPVRYRRVRAAVRTLRALALHDDAVAAFLAGDDAALAVMTAAVGVLEAARLTVDTGDSAQAHLRRAVRWRAYSRGPVSALHRACATDVCRGSLRLLAGLS